jgi:hypothetical protein
MAEAERQIKLECSWGRSRRREKTVAVALVLLGLALTSCGSGTTRSSHSSRAGSATTLRGTPVGGTSDDETIAERDRVCTAVMGSEGFNAVVVIRLIAKRYRDSTSSLHGLTPQNLAATVPHCRFVDAISPSAEPDTVSLELSDQRVVAAAFDPKLGCTGSITDSDAAHDRLYGGNDMRYSATRPCTAHFFASLSS